MLNIMVDPNIYVPQSCVPVGALSIKQETNVLTVTCRVQLPQCSLGCSVLPFHCICLEIISTREKLFKVNSLKMSVFALIC